MRDLFNANTQIGGAWQLEGPTIQIEGGEDLIIDQAGFNYNRGINRFSPLNSAKEYLSVGRPTGQLQLGAVVSPNRTALETFLRKYSDPCNIDRNVIGFQPAGLRDCTDANGNFNPLEFVLRGALLQGLGLTVQQMGNGLHIVRANMTIFFLTLELVANDAAGLQDPLLANAA